MPELSQATLADWVAELRGPHRNRARRLVEQSGAAALLLWEVGDQLPDVAWLLELTETLDPARARREVEARLASGELFVVRAARRLGLELPASLLESPDPQVRAVAIRAGLGDAQVRRYVNAERELPEVLAAVGRCPAEVQADLLADSRWEVRAAAVRALAAGSERPLERVRELACSPVLEHQVAAVALLEHWGDAEWLAQRWPDAGR